MKGNLFASVEQLLANWIFQVQNQNILSFPITKKMEQ